MMTLLKVDKLVYEGNCSESSGFCKVNALCKFSEGYALPRSLPHLSNAVGQLYIKVLIV